MAINKKIPGGKMKVTGKTKKPLNGHSTKFMVADLSTFEYLETKCKMAGITLTQLCRKEKIRRGTIARWKHDEPKSIRIFRKLESGIEKAKKNLDNKNYIDEDF